MICPKCKKEIPEKVIKCSFCNTRVATICKKCHAYNSIYNMNCVECGNELLKACPECSGLNIPEAKKCRKCGHVFETQQVDKSQVDNDEQNSQENQVQSPQIQQNQISYDAIYYSQQSAKDHLKAAFLSQDKRIISLNGKQGVGKTIVLKSAINEVNEANNQFIWLVGECSPITQISPAGLIQNLLLTFFNIPNFCIDNLQLKKESQKFFQSEFPTLNNEEIFNLLNLLYPKNTDFYENIYKNKEKTYTLLKKVFKTIIETGKTIMVIENLEYIDGFSYEFIHVLLNENYAQNNLKILLTYTDTRPAQAYLYSESLKNDEYFNISLSHLDRSQLDLFVDRFFPQEDPCPKRIKEKLQTLSQGNPATLEQYVCLLSDYKKLNNSFEIVFPSTFSEVVKKRLEYLKSDEITYKVLLTAVIQGQNFSPVITNQVLSLDLGVLEETLNKLQSLNFIIPVTQNYYSFKNSILWNELFSLAKQDEEFSMLNNSMYEIYSQYVLSSRSRIAVLAQNLNQDLSALTFWTDCIKIAAFVGDTNLYAISQKQCLSIIEKLENTDNSLIKNNIYERLGKLLAATNPKEASIYLPNAIQNAKNIDNMYKEIELTGYLAQCCTLLGNNNGVIECIESTLEKIDITFELEIAMLKARKLRPLLNIGNCGELINLADNEILPTLEKFIGAKPHKNISIKTLYKTWLQTYLYLAQALVFQGNNRSFEVISTLFELFEKNNFTDKSFICKTKLTLAFANTIKGDFVESEKILEDIIKTYRTDIMDNRDIVRWNLINVLNSLIQKKYKGIKEELFQVVTFANNTHDEFTKNIIKTFLGKLLKDEDSVKQALEIYSQQITYFSKEKNAIGALLNWYYIAEAKLVTEGPKASLEVSTKALEVAKNPKINNYLFVVLFNKIIAEATMIEGDYESAKMHIEKAVMVAKKFELLNLLAELYLMYGKYLQDLALVKTDSQGEYVVGASKMFKKAELMAYSLKNEYLVTTIAKTKAVLKSFCQLNGIVVTGE